MQRLRDADLRRLLDFVSEAATATLGDRSQVIAFVVERLGTLLPADAVLATGWDPGVRRVTTVATDPRFAALRQQEPELWAACLAQHPTVVYFGRTGGGEAIRFSDLVSRAQYRGSALYEHFFRPVEVAYKLDTRIPTGSTHVDVGCCRARGDFSDAERATLEALNPHLTALLRRAEAGAATSRLRARFGLTAREGEVLALLAQGMGNGDIARTLFLSVGTVRKHLEHVYAKLGVSTRTAAVACALDGSITAPAREILRRLEATEPAGAYALTPRELEVLTRASLGETNAAIAVELHVAPETVNKHLDNVYGKLGVKSRSQAAGRALSLGLV